MITLHFHLLPQYKYELFHIYFTWFHCTGRYELNELTLLSMCGFIAQLVEHRTGIAEVMGSNPVEALIFFRLLLSNCLNWKIYCDDHTSLSLFVLLSLMQYISVSFQRGRVTCDESCAITCIHPGHLRLIYEAKIQVLSVFSWKPAQPRYVKQKVSYF